MIKRLVYRSNPLSIIREHGTYDIIFGIICRRPCYLVFCEYSVLDKFAPQSWCHISVNNIVLHIFPTAYYPIGSNRKYPGSFWSFAIDLADHHIGLGFLCFAIHLLNHVGFNIVVTIYHQNIFPSGLQVTVALSNGCAHVMLMAESAHLRFSMGIVLQHPPHDFHAIIRRAIIDKQKIDIVKGLFKQTTDTPFDIGFDIVYRYCKSDLGIHKSDRLINGCVITATSFRTTNPYIQL